MTKLNLPTRRMGVLPEQVFLPAAYRLPQGERRCPRATLGRRSIVKMLYNSRQ